jgi:hypothetical protein
MTTTPGDESDDHADAGLQEAFAFTCLHCGHGWEQTYDVEIHLDAESREIRYYYADGKRLPPPLMAECPNCGERKARILRAGVVAAVLAQMPHHHKHGTHWRFRRHK